MKPALLQPQPLRDSPRAPHTGLPRCWGRVRTGHFTLQGETCRGHWREVTGVVGQAYSENRGAPQLLHNTATA